MKIITYPASQRITPVDGFSLNERIGDKQYIIYNVVNSIYLATMNPDGTQWNSNLIFEVDDGDVVGATCEIYDNLIYAVVTISTPTTYIYRLLKFNYSGSVVFNSIIGQDGYGFSHFDFAVNKIYYSKLDSSSYLWIGTSDLNGNSFVGNKVNYQFTYYYIQWIRIGSKLVYFFNTNSYLYKATSDLDCSNFVYEIAKDSLNQNIRCSSLGGGATDGLYLYISFLSVIGSTYKNYIARYDGSSFYHIEMIYTGDYIDDTFCQDGSYCVVGGGYYAEYDTSSLLLVSDTTFYEGSSNDIWSSDVCILPDGNVYVWIKFGLNDVLELWTYPGDYISPSTSGYPWPKFQSNIEHTGYSNNAVNTLTNPSFTWKYNILNDDLFSDIVIDADNTIYFGTKYGKVIALNSNGSLKWECSISWEELDYEGNTVTITPDLHYGCPAIAIDGTIYIASGNEIDNDDYNGSSRLFAINPNGTLKWTYHILSAHYTTPSPITIANDGTILFTSYYVYAINHDGTKKWTNATHYTFSCPLLYNNYIYLLGTAGGLYIVNLNDGTKLPDWSNVTGWTNYYYDNPKQPIIGNNIHVGYPVSAINLLTGITEWTYPIDTYSKLSADSNGTIYFCHHTIIYAINSDGTLKWTYQLNGSMDNMGNIVIDFNGNVYFIIMKGYDNNTTLYGLDSNGNLFYEYVLDNIDRIYNLAIGGDNCLYVSNKIFVAKIGEYIPPIPLPQVQCRATQIITSARTGKIIIPVPIL